MTLINKCPVCKRFKSFHKGGCPAIKVYTKIEKAQHIFNFLKHQIACLLFAIGSFYALGASWMDFKVHEDQVDIEVMDIRSDAEGSAYFLLDEHKHCRSGDKPKNAVKVVGVISRMNPNDPYSYTEKRRKIDAALEQAVDKVDKGFDGIAAFCYKFKKGKPENATGYSVL